MYRRAAALARHPLFVAALLLAAVGAPVRAQARLGTIEGTVSDSSSGERRPGATVIVLGTTRGAVSDENGRFTIADIAAGSTTLRARQFGYRPVTVTIDVRGGGVTSVRLSMLPAPVQLGAVRAQARSPERDRFELATGVGHLSITPSSVTSVPSIGEPDVMRTVQLMPGVNARNDFSAGYNVRGGESDQNLILLDGYPIYNPFHLGGLFSTFLDETVGSIDLLTGGFGAAYGSRLSSVLDVGSATPFATGVHGTAGVSVISSSLSLGSASPDGRSSWMAAGRRTYADKLVAALSDRTFPYHFVDGQFHGTHAIGQGNARVEATAYLGEDLLDGDFATLGDSTQSGGGMFDFGWQNQVLGTTFANEWRQPVRLPVVGMSDSIAVQQRVSFTRFATALDLGGGALQLRNSVRESRATGALSLYRGTHQRQLGYEVSEYRIRYDVQSLGVSSPLYSLAQSPIAGALYYTDAWKPTRRLLLEGGARLEHLTGRNWTGLSPRLSAKYFVTPDLAVTAAVGRFAQWMHSLNREDIPVRIFDFWVASDPYVEVSRATHTVLGMEQWLGPLRFARVEGWVKRYEHLLEQNTADDPSVRGDEFLDSRGTSFGVDVLLRQLEVGQFGGWLAYTYGVSARVRDTVGYWPGHDRRHNLNLVGTWKPNDHYTFAARFGYASGTPFTDIVGQVVRRVYDPGRNRYGNDSPLNEVEPVGGVRNASRYPFFQRLDLSVSRVGEWRGVRLTPYLSVVNAYNAKNVFIYTFNYRRNPPTREASSQIPLLPTAGLTVAF